MKRSAALALHDYYHYYLSEGEYEKAGVLETSIAGRDGFASEPDRKLSKRLQAVLDRLNPAAGKQTPAGAAGKRKGKKKASGTRRR